MIEGLFQTSGNQQASSILNRANVKTGSKCCSLIMGGFLAGWATNPISMMEAYMLKSFPCHIKVLPHQRCDDATPLGYFDIPHSKRSA